MSQKRFFFFFACFFYFAFSMLLIQFVLLSRVLGPRLVQKRVEFPSWEVLNLGLVLTVIKRWLKIRLKSCGSNISMTRVGFEACLRCRKDKYIQRRIQNPFRHLRSQSAFTLSKLTIETLEQGVKYVQS